MYVHEHNTISRALLVHSLTQLLTYLLHLDERQLLLSSYTTPFHQAMANMLTLLIRINPREATGTRGAHCNSFVSFTDHAFEKELETIL